jgi:coenzyme PQQ precursor peptide PqqA
VAAPGGLIAGWAMLARCTAAAQQPYLQPRLTHENHEASLMILPFRGALHLPNMQGGGASWPPAEKAKESSMKWETPMATDFRYGMEITMYIANR